VTENNRGIAAGAWVVAIERQQSFHRVAGWPGFIAFHPGCRRQLRL